MGQKKLIRFEELKTFANVLQYPVGMQGQWKNYFKNENPITLELACGKGEYTVGLSRLYPFRNFIGVDVKGNRIWKGAKIALQEGLNNVLFLRTQIDRIAEYYGANEVSEIWLTFPDPQLRFSKIKKRLTHPKFLRMYKQFLKPGGIVHLKTDSPDLYHFTKTVISFYNLNLLADTDDVYATEKVSDELSIKTYYESLDIAQSNRIHYLSFKIDNNLPIEKDEDLKKMYSEQSSE